MELTKFTDLLRRVPPNERPQTVVFYDGFNEIGCGFYNGAGNLSASLRAKLGTLVTGKYGNMAIYSASNWLKERSMLWRRYFAKKVEYRVFDYLKEDPNLKSAENLQKTTDIYVENIKMIEAICSAYNIKPYFFLQPMLHTKMPRTPFEEKILNNLGTDWNKFGLDFYTKTAKKMAGNPNFYDLSTILNNRTNNDYYDQGHTAPYTPRVIGKKIFEVMNK
jgi:hypothetical protein